ncbi:nuclease-related domain-containing DEAD/DEAH box helicase [Ferviditalea candida]|uniref:NERD domain-containing protein n=1 Tax=Ferviditalea candida TaxID=3108399 RepID=A0ABU5ZHR5_9BACL|nr:NERD domain-containing protein [Paenibacillaceae bacterium T2]
MARMIPDLPPDAIENDGERVFYSAVQESLSEEFTVFYSYKFYRQENEDHEIREADFIIVHPSLGFTVVEVKQGDIAYINGQWNEFKNGGYQPLHKDPVQQARTAMYEILQSYTKRSGGRRFPLRVRFALCFPECSQISGFLPSMLKEGSVWTARDLDRLEDKLWELFDMRDRQEEKEAVNDLISKVLAPSFKLFSSLEDKIQSFRKQAQIILTEEQERILYETEEDRRKIFFGAAGTGKTYIAMEKARRSAEQGKRVFLTCFNKNLVRLFDEYVKNPLVTGKNYHDYLYELLKEKGYEWVEPSDGEASRQFFDVELPATGFDYFDQASQEEKFDVIIIDEGQNFKEDWFLCLENMLKDNGELYIFADPNQNLFGSSVDALKKYDMSKQRLTYNLRNSEKINE